MDPWKAHDRRPLPADHPDRVICTALTEALVQVCGSDLARKLAEFAPIKRCRDDNRYCFAWDDETFKPGFIEVPTTGTLRLATLLHEMGHAYHCLMYPAYSAAIREEAPNWAEAAAQILVYKAEQVGALDKTAAYDQDQLMPEEVQHLARMAMNFSHWQMAIKYLIRGPNRVESQAAYT